VNDQKNLVAIACGLTEEEAKAILKRVKIYAAGITLAADEAEGGYGWDVYATWTEDVIKEMDMPSSVGAGCERPFVRAYVTQAIVSKLAKAVVELEAKKK
jgi:hypothetical protein